jgi:hypothetical protein
MLMRSTVRFPLHGWFGKGHTARRAASLTAGKPREAMRCINGCALSFTDGN